MIFLELKIQPDFPPDLLTQAAQAALDSSAASDSDLTLLLAGDEEIRLLNRDYLGSDSPTDVLSFPADEVDPESGHRYLGDVVVSLPRAAAQALARGHAVEAETQLLVVHGVLHLLGHDHANADGKDLMWQIQAQVLDGLGLKIDVSEE